MLCAHNDIVCAVDEKRTVALVLLDPSAAFDTVDHATLLYSQFSSDGSMSATRLGHDVDQSASTAAGSVVGSVEFITYTCTPRLHRRCQKLVLIAKTTAQH